MPDAPTDPRRKPLQQRAHATVEALLEATAQLLVEVGYARASTNQIAQRAGVSIGSLYQYFPHKDALILALLDRFVDRQFQVLRQHLAGVRDHEPRSLVRATVTALLSVKREAPELTRVLFEQIPRTGEFARVDGWMERSILLLRDAIASRAEDVRPADPHLAALVMVHAFHGVVNHAAIKQPELLSDDRLVDELTELFARYLEPAPHAAP